MRNRYILRDPERGIPFLSHVEFQFDRPGGQHSHAELQILGILSGTVEVAMPEETRSVEAGDMVVIPAGVHHTVPVNANRREVQLLDLRIDTRNQGDLARTVADAAWPSFAHASPHELARIAEALSEGATLDGTAQKAAIHRAAWSLVGLLASSSGSAGRVDRRIAVAEQFMLQRLAQPISLGDVADCCAVSVSQLNRLYRSSGLGAPARRLRAMRIDRARELLATSLFTVKEIAFACGFVCPNHFCRLFKVETGLTPGDYRDREGARHAITAWENSSPGSRTSARPAQGTRH